VSYGRAKRPLPRADVLLSKVPSAIAKLERRIQELTASQPPNDGDDISGSALLIANKVNATIEEIFGTNTADRRDFYIDKAWFTPSFGPTDWNYKRATFARGCERTFRTIQAAIDRLKERLSDAENELADRSLKAYEGLDLHPEIARAASELYRNGHYANAIEDAVKALNALVRLRSGENGDGTSLMQAVFSSKNPILRFNDLQDETDRNEQTGFMMMFAGAVAGLRNPRAHRLIKDDPERALEFIAFVSLLAKLLDGAKK
jgi:uncharacterized protein (TIGR02391 family)